MKIVPNLSANKVDHFKKNKELDKIPLNAIMAYSPSKIKNKKNKVLRGKSEIAINLFEDQLKLSVAKKEEELKIKADRKKMIENMKQKINNFLNETCFQITMTFVTLYALIGDDIRLIMVAPEDDGQFVTFTIFSMILFTIELMLASIGQEGYLNSFFFWLDLVSTFSLLTDIQPVMDTFMNIGYVPDPSEGMLGVSTGN